MSKGTISFFGLGVLGSALARRLVGSGFEVFGFDPSKEALSKASNHGIKRGEQAHIGTSDFVLTSLPDDNVLRQVLWGESGVLEHMKGGSVLIELSTILPSTLHEVVARAAGLGVRVVDSPISGGPPEALAGTVKLLVGAEEDALSAARPVLECLGETYHIGPPGDGKTVKLVNNMMTMGNVAVAAEAFNLGVKAGMDPSRLFDVLSNSGGRSFHFLKRFPKVLARDFAPGFSSAMGEKDLRLALQMSHETRSPTLVTALVHQLYEMTCQSGRAGEDIISVIKLFEHEGGDES